ncbi:KAP family P-loop NTPase fold protein [Myroides marinus]|uniref:KAP family P-loop NTPase fold protein n=1 Tax=Myroides marinus TaxID=703342 RepID=UPI0025789DB8|nr:P-loop NTPase fold protein [Myroides marinus]MDM1378450.1 hypothetical protein [Myroides marinus]MDM1385721.1 hypothetical protein [Myroides marinus]MDM1392934.1 hypothetical protein [Myroides marinus]
MTSNHKITATCKKYILRVLVALAIVVLFHSLLNALFTKMLSVLPIEFGELYVDVAIGGLTLLGAVFISLKWLEKHKYKLFVIWGFGVFLHLLDTFYWQDWDYTPMSFPMINYVVYFLYVFPFVLVVKSIVEKAHYSRIEETKEDKLNDSFGYTVHARKLLEFIKNRKSRDSYAIGINAKWGEGKSFFIDLFKEELANSKSGKELIVVDFKPWFSHSPLDIINDFFTVFGERLEEEGIFIQSDLDKYKEALMGVETEEPLLNQLLKSVKELFDNDSKSSSLLYERINNVLKEENRRIIVVIDDLDRLTKEELFEVIKLVRNSGSLKNTFFVLAYDREYLEQALKDLQVGKHDKYLEKVIQKELKLPLVQKRDLVTYQINYLAKNYGVEYGEVLKAFFEKSAIDIYEEHKNLFNKRYNKEFIDDLMYHYLYIKEEVYFEDFFILHVLYNDKRFDFEGFYKVCQEFELPIYKGDEGYMKLSLNNELEKFRKVVFSFMSPYDKEPFFKSIFDTLWKNRKINDKAFFSCTRVMNVYFSNVVDESSFLTKENFRELVLNNSFEVISNELDHIEYHRVSFFNKLDYYINYLVKEKVYTKNELNDIGIKLLKVIDVLLVSNREVFSSSESPIKEKDNLINNILNLFEKSFEMTKEQIVSNFFKEGICYLQFEFLYKLINKYYIYSENGLSIDMEVFKRVDVAINLLEKVLVSICSSSSIEIGEKIWKFEDLWVYTKDLDLKEVDKIKKNFYQENAKEINQYFESRFRNEEFRLWLTGKDTD